MKENCALSNGGDWTLTLAPDSQAQVGDRVKIELSGKHYLAAGVLIFIMPLVLMTLMYIIGQKLFAEGFAVFLAFFGFAVGIAVAYLVGRGKGAEKFRYRIIEILPKDPDAHRD